MDYNMFLSNHIAEFFSHQFLWKETINSHQGKIASEATTVGWMGPGVLSHAQMYLDLLGEFGWSKGGVATSNVIQNERFIEF